jgi:hypothetical protein
MWAPAGRPRAWVRAGGARLLGAGARALARRARRAAGPEPKRRRAEPSERLGLGRRLARQQRRAGGRAEVGVGAGQEQVARDGARW